jgi:hypothetical protein
MRTHGRDAGRMFMMTTTFYLFLGGMTMLVIACSPLY